MPGWSKPHTHSNPNNLALFGHEITLYRFNHGGGAHTIAGGAQMGAGAEPPPPLAPLTLTTARNRFIVSCPRVHLSEGPLEI